jgi:ABC-type ATPase with predicted acetyltransferase domain
MNDHQFETAMALVARYASSHGPPEQISAPWSCPNCGEQCESQFTECWKCGASRPSNR